MPTGPLRRRNRPRGLRAGARRNLREHFCAVPDPRARRGVRHTVMSILLLASAAVLTGARSFTDIRPSTARTCCGRQRPIRHLSGALASVCGWNKRAVGLFTSRVVAIAQRRAVRWRQWCQGRDRGG
ncbi:transposase family protein [Amycolatopsis sp. H20-H5]|uniref:transposase family protein n=1 Tax=Amycolatopsis sp. H20-H5 TaxID=3046309 RepID=UPI003FA35324